MATIGQHASGESPEQDDTSIEAESPASAGPNSHDRIDGAGSDGFENGGYDDEASGDVLSWSGERLLIP